MKKILISLGVLLSVLVVGRVSQTQVIKNPTGYSFTCPDHAGDDAHEIAIVRESDGVTVSTIPLGDPPAVNGVVTGSLNVQPLAFGAYRARVRAIASGISSDWSDPTTVFERAPGKPGGVVVQ